MKKYLISTVLISSITLTGCITTLSLPADQRPNHWGQVISTSNNFYQISPTVFRSEQPDHSLLPALKQHKISRVINLRQRNPDQKVFENQPFNLTHIPIQTWAIDRNDLLQVMQAIQLAEQKQENVLIHCYHGSDRTGVSVAMYRVLFQNWSREDALNEMKHGGYGFHPIWTNIEKLMSAENIQWTRAQLNHSKVITTNTLAH
ncbi:dual specificity protein phosphatase-like protein [Acinetobacter calcoaceticus]|uniref:Dual specificity protein phosphatase-like protein n=1 Tax=Acinetobacter calcoaceticus TaxID=471 RepID=A0A4R1XJ52_ACICA|nr:dual specificity protein phosphatase-like protein [Acinetobacter calcoaceticus]